MHTHDEQVRISIHMRRIWIICCFFLKCIRHKLIFKSKKYRKRAREREVKKLNERRGVSTQPRSTYHMGICVSAYVYWRVFFGMKIVCCFWSYRIQSVEINLKQPLGKMLILIISVHIRVSENVRMKERL